MRVRLRYAVLMTLVICLGVGSRSGSPLIPKLISTYAGDVLWALFVYLGLRILQPRATRWISLAGAGVISVAVEVSQLYHAPWLDALRQTTLGALVLGQEFLWSDLACYGLGLLLGLSSEFFIHPKQITQVLKERIV